MNSGQIVGLVLMFALFLIPSGLFIGMVAGRLLKLPTAGRVAATVAVAALAAYFAVLHTGPTPDSDCSQSPPHAPHRC